ncbi:MAG: NAD-dependent epimerase/dehydratase family protein [Coriobacteriia bacterium]|nr:NAD-dependent epimerase/dehydratase family protein [Coriobacteriia bacterium]
MIRVLITGSAGFVGRNLMQALSEQGDLEVSGYDTADGPEQLSAALATADVVVHLAGVNRPTHSEEFEQGNTGFTKLMCDTLREFGRTPKIIMSSSIQAALENPYGISKREAEAELERFAADTGSEVVVFRFKNIFGKWSRPEYNSVVATFCYRVSHGIPLTIDDPGREMELVYVDDVVAAITHEMRNRPEEPRFRFAEEMLGFCVSLGDLADTIRSFRAMRETCVLPELGDRFTSYLYSTYVSFLDGPDTAYGLDAKSDERGSLAEFVKSSHGGQIFVSRTKPGVTRGNHYHHSKTEKFLVVEGRALVRLRHLQTNEIVEHEIAGSDYRVVDIPPGYTHSIENIGESELVVLFWASEMFDPSAPDTYFCEVSH